MTKKRKAPERQTPGLGKMSNRGNGGQSHHIRLFSKVKFSLSIAAIRATFFLRGCGL